MSDIIVVVTGGFDPLHSGHIAYFKEAKKLGNKLIVGINSDAWLTKKKGSPFLPFNERLEIVSNIDVVDEAIGFHDDELNSAADAISQTIQRYPNSKIVFANGVDLGSHKKKKKKKFSSNDNVIFEFGVGGDFKMNS